MKKCPRVRINKAKQKYPLDLKLLSSMILYLHFALLSRHDALAHTVLDTVVEETLTIHLLKCTGKEKKAEWVKI